MENKTILVIDDSMTDFLYAKKILIHAGYKVVYAPSGKVGIEEAKRSLPACILMDVVMPEMNGFQATRALSREVVTADIPVLMLSAKALETDQVWAQRQGAKGYLVKPADPGQLLDKLKLLLGN
ncbi:MAG: twitching motility two-component system response regulator PilH [Arenicella sp.]|jgi:twitching motility two-component system response regulator PilH